MRTPLINKLIGGGMLFMAIAVLLVNQYTPAKAQGNPNKRIPDVVMLQYKTLLGPLVHTPAGSNRETLDMIVDYSSRSHNSPVIPNGASMGESMSFLMGQGFTFQLVGVNQYLFTRQ